MGVYFLSIVHDERESNVSSEGNEYIADQLHQRTGSRTELVSKLVYNILIYLQHGGVCKYTGVRAISSIVNPRVHHKGRQYGYTVNGEGSVTLLQHNHFT